MYNDEGVSEITNMLQQVKDLDEMSLWLFSFKTPGKGSHRVYNHDHVPPGRGRVEFPFTLGDSEMASPTFSRSILTLFTGEGGELALSLLLEMFCQAKGIKYLLSQKERAGGTLIFDC